MSENSLAESTYEKSLTESTSTQGTTALSDSLRTKAIALLGSGVKSSQVAMALGVSPSRISQLLAESEVAEEVSALRYADLSAHSERDAAYDALESTLQSKLKSAIPLMFKPAEITRALQMVNTARRSNTINADPEVQAGTITQLILPVEILQKFTMNVNNQIISAQTGDDTQNLVTMQSGTLLEGTKKRIAQKASEPEEQKTISSYNI